MLAGGEAEVGYKIVVGAIFLGTSAPLSASNREQTHLLYDENSGADGGGVRDGFVAVDRDLLAGFDLREEGVDWRRGVPGAAHVGDVGGKLVVVN